MFSQATEVMVREYGLTGMVMELVREISRVDTKELARDTSGTRLVICRDEDPDLIGSDTFFNGSGSGSYLLKRICEDLKNIIFYEKKNCR